MKKYFSLAFIILAITLIGFTFTGCMGMMGGAAAPPPSPTRAPEATLPPDRDPEAEFRTFNGLGFKIDFQENWHVISVNEDYLREDFADSGVVRELISRTNSATGQTEVAEVKIFRNSTDLEGAGRTEVIFASEDVFATDGTPTFFPTISVYTYRIEEDDFNIAEYINEQISDLRSRNFGFYFENNNVVEIQEIEFDNGTTGRFIQYTGNITTDSAPNLVVKQIYVYDNENSNLFIITYVAMEANFSDDEYMVIANRTLRSFRME